MSGRRIVNCFDEAGGRSEIVVEASGASVRMQAARRCRLTLSPQEVHQLREALADAAAQALGAGGWESSS